MKRTMKTSTPLTRLCLSTSLLGIALTTACGEDYHEPVWSQTFESESTNYESCGTDIAIDPEGNIVVVGEYKGRLDLGTGELPFIRNGSAQFVAKYTSDGTNLWSRLLSTDDFTARLAVDQQGTIVVAASFSNSVTLGDVTLTTVLGGRDAFVVTLDSSGQYLWSKNFGGPGWTHVMGVGTDEGRITLAGFFDSEISFGSTPLSAIGDGDGYIARLDSTGEHLWSDRFGGVGGDHALGLSVASDGKVAIAGDALGDAPSDVVLTYSASGDLQESWALPPETLNAVAWAKDGRDLFVHASIEEPQTLGDGETRVSGDFLARVAPGGEPVWISQKSENEREWRDIAVDDQDRVHLVSDSRVGSGDGRIVWVTSYDADGDKLGRTEVLNSLGGARVTAVAAGPDGQIVLTGCAKDDGFFGGDENLFIVQVRAP